MMHIIVKSYLGVKDLAHLQKYFLAWRYKSIVEYISSMHGAIGLIYRTINRIRIGKITHWEKALNTQIGRLDFNHSPKSHKSQKQSKSL